MQFSNCGAKLVIIFDMCKSLNVFFLLNQHFWWFLHTFWRKRHNRGEPRNGQWKMDNPRMGSAVRAPEVVLCVARNTRAPRLLLKCPPDILGAAVSLHPTGGSRMASGAMSKKNSRIVSGGTTKKGSDNIRGNRQSRIARGI